MSKRVRVRMLVGPEVGEGRVAQRVPQDNVGAVRVGCRGGHSRREEEEQFSDTYPSFLESSMPLQAPGCALHFPSRAYSHTVGE